MTQSTFLDTDSYRSGLVRFRRSLTTKDRVVIGSMFGFVAGLHVVGWTVLAGAVVPQHLTLGDGKTFGIALGVTAYLLRRRHTFDADHIAAIDNTTRKLVSENTKPLSVGFWSSSATPASSSDWIHTVSATSEPLRGCVLDGW